MDCTVLARCRVKVALLYSGLFLWGANFRYFHGSPRYHKIFHPRNFQPTKFSTQCSAVNTCSNLDWRRFVRFFFATCSALDPQGPLAQAVLRVMAEKVNREV